MKKLTSKKIAFYILLSLTFVTGTEGKNKKQKQKGKTSRNNAAAVIGPYEQEKPVQT